MILDCYERRSLIIISNLEFSQWNTVFGDNRLTTALIDRLIHHSHIVIFSGENYRLTQFTDRQRAGNWQEHQDQCHSGLFPRQEDLLKVVYWAVLPRFLYV